MLFLCKTTQIYMQYIIKYNSIFVLLNFMGERRFKKLSIKALYGCGNEQKV